MVEVVGVEEEAVEIEEIVEIEVAETRLRNRLPGPASVVQNIQIFHLVSGRGAGCTISGGSQLISVQSPPRALGRTSSLQNHQNEI